MKYCLLLLLLLTAHFSFNQTAEFDALLNDLYAPDEPGGTALVAKEGEVIYHKAFGMANMELDVAMRPEMVFQIGSITKQFTAIAILMLMEQGKLDLDDDITEFIPDYPTQGHHISVHHLLTHTSGIKSYTSIPEWYDIWRNDMEPMEMIDFFKKDSLEFPPGEQWSYNNSAYFILGYIIEVVSEQTYEAFIEENIFQPLQMNNSLYGSTSELIENRAYGYQQGGNGFVNVEFLSMTQPYAAGSLMSTVEDLYKWNSALHAHKLIKEETLKLAFQNYSPNKGQAGYGYGWGLNFIGESVTYEHAGGIFGYVTNAIYLPEEDVFVALFSNCNCRPPIETSTKMAAIAIGNPFPTIAEGIELKKKHLEKWVGVYQYADSSLLEVTTDGNVLMFREEGDPNDTLYALSKNTFVFDDNISQLVFEEKEDSIKATYKYRLYEESAIQVDLKMPGMELNQETLARYVGVYVFAAKFEFNIYIAEDKLMAEMTGQKPVELIPQTETLFFVNGVEGKVEFIEDPVGTYNRVIFKQGLMQMEATKKEE